MGYASEMGYDGYSEEDVPGTHAYNEEQYPTIQIVEDGYVVEKRYCKSCGSIDVGVSKKGKYYCKKICRENK